MSSNIDKVSASARLAAVVASSDDAIISKNLRGIITSWNKGAEELFGYVEDEVLGRSVTLLIPDDRAEEEPEILKRLARGETIDHLETIRRHKSGRLLDVSLSIAPLYNDDGFVVGASKTARDTTRQHQTEIDLARLAAIIESSSDAIISKDLNGIIQSWNPGAQQIFGYTAEEVIGQPVTILMPQDRVDEEPGILGRIRRGEKVNHYETVRQHKDGTLIDISLNVSPVYDAHGKVVGASKIARDITEHKKVAKLTAERVTAQRLLESQEAERSRIARDLHDHLGQQMTGFRLQLESLLKICEDVHLKSKVEELRTQAKKMDRDIGFLSWELRPSELDTLGLVDALASFVNEWSSQYEISAHFHSDLKESEKTPVSSSHGVEINLYRILQECLNNILKHAEASEVNVLLHHIGGQIVLVVEDNGNGIKDLRRGRQTKNKGGLGLIGMLERAALMGGTLEIESEPSKGTTILVRIPYRTKISPE